MSSRNKHSARKSTAKPAKKPATKKPATKKPAAKKPAANKSTAKKPAANKSTANKSTANKSTANKSTANKSTAIPPRVAIKKALVRRFAKQNAIHVALGEELSRVLGKAAAERAAFDKAITALMQIDDGLPAHASPGEVLVPEFLSEGDTHNPMIHERVVSFDKKRDWDRLYAALSDAIRDYEARVTD